MRPPVPPAARASSRASPAAGGAAAAALPRRRGAPPAPWRGSLALAALAYLCFVVYGSLVPLQYRPMPLATAMAVFADIRYLQLGIGSRADWVANILLFVPLAFLWCGVLWPWRRAWARPLVAAMVVAVGVLLACAIEFTQLFFPPRTVSINDLIAEAAGAVIGCALWWIAGARLLRWAQRWVVARQPASVGEFVLLPYLFILFGYNLLPLDLTISPVEVYHKWNEGRVRLIPFSTTYSDAAHQAYDLLADVAAWILAAMLWRWGYGKSAKSAIWFALWSATALECLQLLVYSRVTDTTDIITAGIGGAIGAFLARWLPGSASAPAAASAPHAASRGALRAAMPWVIAAGIWFAVMAAVFWYPFDFSVDRGFVRDRLAGLRRVPFEAYYFGTEFRAVTEVLHKLAFMLPLGLLLGGLKAAGLRRLPGALADVLLIGCIGAAAAAIETGQLFLPSKNADLTDWILEVAGGVFGYWLILAVRAKLDAGRAP